jgi:hypothetical protein
MKVEIAADYVHLQLQQASRTPPQAVFAERTPHDVRVLKL